MRKAKALIFISGNGSNLQNIIDNIDSGYINMDIVAVVSDNPGAGGLKKAKTAKIETIITDMTKDDLSNLSKITDENLNYLPLVNGEISKLSTQRDSSITLENETFASPRSHG